MAQLSFSCGDAKLDAALADLMTAAASKREGGGEALEPKTEREHRLVAAIQHDLEIAAQMGQTLLEAHQQLCAKYAADMDEKASKIEELQQVAYHAQKGAEEERRKAVQTAADADREIRALERKMDEQREKAAKELREAASMKTELAGVKEDYALAVERAELAEKQLKEMSLRHERAIEDLRQKHARALQEHQTGTAHSEEQLVAEVEAMAALLEETQTLLDASELHVAELEGAVERGSHETHSLQCRLANTERDLQQRDDEMELMFKSLDESRKKIKELQDQLDEKAGTSKGSMTLLQEVDDQRKEWQHKYTQLKGRHENLAKIHDTTKQQMNRLQAQLASMVQLGGTKANSERLKSLEQELAQKEAEISLLQARLHSAERDDAHRAQGARLREAYLVSETGSVDEKYLEYLQLHSANLEERLQGTLRELRTAELRAFDEGQKASQQAAKLYRAQQERDQHAAEIGQLQL
eukprot:comp21593_c0_seq2/m.30211 comp21593_c0_seq2/g.30211  ORF comp21593_c0_seq2/g.30211 comp21593_c0_seq2/m.30211 type:complete len:471 (-) comp21593_c0_seq2:435-1847(-)